MGAGLDGQVAEGGGFDRSGDHGQAGRVGGELAQQPVLRAAAHDVDHLHRGTGQIGRSMDGAGVGGRQGVEDAAHRGGLGERPARRVGDPLGHPSGWDEGGVVDVDAWAVAGQPCGSSEEVVEIVPAPCALALLQQPETADVAQEPDAAVDAELVGEVGRAGRLGEHRSVELEPDEGPGAAGDVGEALGGGGHRDHRGGGVVRSDRGDLGASVGGAASGARRLDRGQSVGGDAEPIEQVGGPLPAANVEQAGGGRVRELGAERTGEPVGDQVGQQHDVRGALPERSPLLGGELVDRVERQELEAVDAVQLGGVDEGVDLVDHLGRAIVAVGDRFGEQHRRSSSRRP